MHTLLAISRKDLSLCYEPADVNRLAAKVTLRPEDPYQTLPPEDKDMSLDWIAERIAPAEILVTGWSTPPLTEALLEKAKNLRAVVHSAGSVKHMVPQSAYARGIAVTNARHALGRGVAETTLGMIIASSKLFVPLGRDIAAGQWNNSPWYLQVMELYNIKIGVVAASEVGKHLLNLLQHFQVERLVYDPYATEQQLQAYGARKVDLATLCRESDVIAVCAPSTPETRHLIGREQLKMMKDRARIVNCARGTVIDEKALTEELTGGRLFACLDVTDPEPPPADHPLRNCPRCMMTPHIAGHATNGRLRQGRLAVDEIFKFLAEGRFAWQVTPDSLTRMG